MKIKITIPNLQQKIKRIEFWKMHKINEVKKQVLLTAIDIQGTAKETVNVDTGRLRSSIDMSKNLEGANAEVEVGSDVEYAAYHEAKYPYLMPAAKEHSSEFSKRIKQILKS